MIWNENIKYTQATTRVKCDKKIKSTLSMKKDCVKSNVDIIITTFKKIHTKSLYKQVFFFIRTRIFSKSHSLLFDFARFFFIYSILYTVWWWNKIGEISRTKSWFIFDTYLDFEFSILLNLLNRFYCPSRKF